MTGDSRYVLREATPVELEEARRVHAAVWASGLSVEQYIDREKHIASNLKTDCWVLASVTEPSRPLCSCETIGKPAIIRSVKDGEERVREGTSYVIGSVFTPEKNRGKGYARVMIYLLAQRLELECEFDALYSDVGKKFYDRFGWKAHPSCHISLPPAASEEPVSRVKLLEAQDLPQLCNKDVDSIKCSFYDTPLSPTVDARIAYLPTPTVVKWHHAREEYVGPLLSGRKPIIKGAIVPSGKRWCIWNRNFNTLDPYSQTMSILRIVDMEGNNNTPEELKVDEIVALLTAAQEQARLWEMNSVVVWSPCERVIKAASKIMGRQVEVVERETDSICSLRWNGEEGPDAKVIWDLNERFAWC